jgi:hypothetical protein
MQQYFRVSPPSVHRMIFALEQRGLITREPGVARSIRVLVPTAELPPLDGAEPTARGQSVAGSAEDPLERARGVEQTGREVVKAMLARAIDIGIDDADSLPLIAAAADAVEKMVRAAGIAPRGARLVRDKAKRGIPRRTWRGSGSCRSPRTGTDEAGPCSPPWITHATPSSPRRSLAAAASPYPKIVGTSRQSLSVYEDPASASSRPESPIGLVL